MALITLQVKQGNLGSITRWQVGANVEGGGVVWTNFVSIGSPIIWDTTMNPVEGNSIFNVVAAGEDGGGGSRHQAQTNATTQLKDGQVWVADFRFGSGSVGTLSQGGSGGFAVAAAIGVVALIAFAFTRR